MRNKIKEKLSCLDNSKSSPRTLELHDHSEFISDYIRSENEYYEFEMLKFLKKRFDISRFVDIGANIGNHCNYFMKFGSTGWAYEPSSVNFSKLAINAGNAFECHRVALSNVNSSDSLVTFNDSLGNCHLLSSFNGSINNWGKGQAIEDIEVRTLDSFHVKKPTLIKIDVEGSELKVLEGAVETLVDFEPVVVIEIHTEETLRNANFPYSRAEIFDFFSHIGYHTKLAFDKTNFIFYKGN
jgi:FkbM family methyltransferase